MTHLLYMVNRTSKVDSFVPKPIVITDHKKIICLWLSIVLTKVLVNAKGFLKETLPHNFLLTVDQTLRHKRHKE